MPNEMLQETELVEQTRQTVRDDFNELVKSAVALGGHIRKETRRANQISLAMLMAFMLFTSILLVSFIRVRDVDDLNPFTGRLGLFITLAFASVFIALYIQKHNTWKTKVAVGPLDIKVGQRIFYGIMLIGSPNSLWMNKEIFLKMITLIWETGPVLVEQGHISELKWQTVQLEISQFTI